MKVKPPILAAILSFTLTQSGNALPQSRSIPTDQPTAQRAPGKPADGMPNTSDNDQQLTLESMIPREGLQFYFEMGSAGLMAGGNAVVPLSKMLAAGPLKVTAGDLAAFVMSNAGALSNAKLVLIGYGTGGAVVVVEAANAADAQQLSAGVTRLLGSKQPTAQAATRDVDVTVRGRMVVAGARAAVARFVHPNDERTLANDPEFMEARTRFSKDPLFAFIELGSGSFGMPSATSGALDAAYTAGSLAALSGIPYAVAVGGSLDGDTTTVHLRFINGSKQTAGLFSGLFKSIAASSAGSTQSMAASFATANTDVFVDLMIDWDKLLDAIQSMIGMFAGAVASGAGDPQSNGGLEASGTKGADLLAMAEASLGFSIKHDLIPTLGNEVAITLSGFNTTTRTTLAGPVAKLEGPMPNDVAKKKSLQFLLILAVRDGAKFEELLHRLINGPTGSPGQPFARTLYRGATINSRKDFAYAITGGFLLAGGSTSEIRRAIDAHALGTSLASATEFRQAFDSRPAALRAYLSSRLSKELYDWLSKEAAKSGAGSEETVTASQTSSPIALSLIPDEDGLMVEARVPTNLTLLALSSMFSARPAPFGISASPGNGASDSGSPRTGGRATPRLTDEDLRSRRP